jgi:hypothetical protein
MPKYQIFSAKTSRFSEVGVVIVTAFFNAGEYPRGESFLLIPDEKGTLFAKSLRFVVKSFNDSPVELNEEFMLVEALGQARIDLAAYIEKEATSLDEIGISELIKPADVKLLVHLWVRGVCKHLVDVYRQTECDPLREFLRPILELPKISISGL